MWGFGKENPPMPDSDELKKSAGKHNYRNIEFDDENTLVSHQVARHFKCEECGKKLGTFRALMAHSKTNHHLDLQK